MRISVCDYSGHPFQVQLSRELARRNHCVLHLHFADFQTPKGRLHLQPSDPGTLQIEGLSLGEAFAKHRFVKRRSQEIEIGRRIAERIATFQPDVILASNLPIDALGRVVRSAKHRNSAFVYWQQDIYGTAVRDILQRNLGYLGTMIGRYYQFLERSAARRSDAVIAISDDFRAELENGFRVPRSNIHIVENWAPLDEIAPVPKINCWSRAHGLTERTVVVYTGTLGLKHNPRMLLALSEQLELRRDTSLVVVSEGPSAVWLDEQARLRCLSALKVVPFQPFEAYSDVLGSADVLVSVLEQGAGSYSVPSKVLSYLCAGRPIVLSAARENLAAKIIARAGAGKVVPADDIGAFVDAVTAMLASPAERHVCGRNARRYAEATFDIVGIADRFERILDAAVRARGGTSSIAVDITANPHAPVAAGRAEAD